MWEIGTLLISFRFVDILAQYYRYAFSYCDVRDVLAQRGIKADTSSVSCVGAQLTQQCRFKLGTPYVPGN